jgi:hypothetical protein
VLSESTYSPGLAFEYFEGTWEKLPPFEAMAPVFSGSVPNIDLSPALEEDYFGFRYFGEIHIRQAGTYAFYTASDDGSMLYIDGERVVDNDGAHATIEQGGLIELDTGWHQIEVLYFEIAGGATLEVSYEGPGIEKMALPDSVLGRRVVGGDLVALEGIELPDSLGLPLGTSREVPVTFLPANASDGKVVFTPSDPGIASMNGFGYIVGLAEGTTWLTGVSREGSYRDSSLLTVFNDIPFIQWTAPADGAHFADSARIPLTFLATDTIGGISGLTLFLNGEQYLHPAAEANSLLLDPLPAGSHEVWLKAEDRFGRTGQSGTLTIWVDSQGTSMLPDVEGTIDITPIPNPFNEHLRFRIRLKQPETLNLKIYDMTGSLVYSSGPHNLQQGSTLIEWDGQNFLDRPVPPGIYLSQWHLHYSPSTTVQQLKVIRE